jgi:hypothetical protein
MQRVRRALTCALSMSLLAGLLLACGPEAVMPTPSPPTATVAPPTASPPASPAPGTPPGATPTPGMSPPPGETWLYLTDFPAEEAIEVSSVVARGDGFVAVGFEPVPGEGFGGRRNGVVWTSTDGRSWARSRPPAFDFFAPLYIADLDGALYAFGEYSICPEFSEEDECEDVPDAGIAAWRSTDGSEWQRLTVPDSMRDAIIDGAVVGLGRLVVYGGAGDDLSGVTWLSVDGEQWHEIRDVTAVDPISALAAGPERLVAFGTRYLPLDDDIETLAGHSDGGGFQPAALPAGQRGRIHAVVHGPVGFVAVGMVFDPASAGAVALVSADGTAWTPAASVPGDVGFHHLLALPGGYLAIGLEASDVDFGIERATAWFSADGLTWAEHGDLLGGEFRQLSGSAAGPGGAVVFASQFEEIDDEEPADLSSGSIHAWFAPPAALP